VTNIKFNENFKENEYAQPSFDVVIISWIRI